MATLAIDETNFASTIDSNETVFIDFWADWCRPCQQFAPVYEKASEDHPDVTFAKVDTEAERGIAAALEIQSIPTIMAFRGGYLVFRESGALPATALTDVIAKVKALDVEELKKQAAESEAADKA